MTDAELRVDNVHLYDSHRNFVANNVPTVYWAWYPLNHSNIIQLRLHYIQGCHPPWIFTASVRITREGNVLTRCLSIWGGVPLSCLERGVGAEYDHPVPMGVPTSNPDHRDTPIQSQRGYPTYSPNWGTDVGYPHQDWQGSTPNIDGGTFSSEMGGISHPQMEVPPIQEWAGCGLHRLCSGQYASCGFPAGRLSSLKSHLPRYFDIYSFKTVLSNTSTFRCPWSWHS